MDITWLGQACFKLRGKNATLVLDPYESEFTGLKLPKDMDANIVLVTHGHEDHNNTGVVTGQPKIFEGPGEYEIGGVVVTGISSFHDNSEGKERGLNTIYNITMDGLRVVHLGDLGQESLTQKQIEEIDETDILFVPVGGVYTIDGEDAAKIVVQLEPKIIIPMHYRIEGLKFELESVDKFLKEMGAEGVVPQPKLLITKDKLPEEPQVVVLSKS